ncbi:MAG: HAMP domain-containing histidine kinase [Prevotellaceae bacterium]|jgi:signal transduction histidine kinase|nr:HAMP domain-containing histidine kinase [Prevotellaceae bacterium]
MSKNNGRPYIKPQRLNREVQARKIEKLQQDIDNQKNVLSAVSKDNERHIIFLSNFLQHDMKNAIHSMDGILSTISNNTISNEELKTLKTSLDVLRQTINNFKELIPHSQNGEFTLNALLSSVEALARGSMKDIEYDFNYDTKSAIIINHSYQALLQILHNVIINATKSMENVSEKKLYVSANIDNAKCEIKIADTGIEIPKENTDKIFTYGFSTTAGTGIGLFHAKYVCDTFKGTINVNTKCSKPFTKEFIINFPIKK